MKTAVKARIARRKNPPVRLPSNRSVREFPRAESLKQTALQLAPLLAVGFALRLYGLTHGAGYHPDERHTVGVVLSLRWGDLNPRSFAYGSFPYYFVFLFSQLARVFLPTNYDNLFLLGRFASALMGTVGIAATYYLGRALRLPRETAWWGALFMTLAFFPVQNCHFFTVDIWLTTACSLALIALLEMCERDDRASALTAGAALGVALAIKISALTLLLPAALAWAYRRHERGDVDKWQAWRPLAWLLLAFVGAFLLCEPYAALDAKTALANLREQMEMANGSAIRPFTLQYLHCPPWLYPLSQLFPACGAPLALTMLAGTALLIYRQVRQARRFQPRIAIPLIWMVAFFVAIGAEHTKFPRYLLPIYPLLALGAAYGLRELEQLISFLFSGKLALPSWWRWAPRGFVLAMAAIFTFAHLEFFARPHTWILASRWIQRNYPQGARTLNEAWDDSLPTGFDAFAFRSVGTLPLYEPETPQRLEQIVTMLENGELMALPTARVYGSILQAEERYPQTAHYYRLLFAGQLGYERVHTFKLYPHFGPWQWNDELADESFSVYTNPKVVIFRNREHLSTVELKRRLSEMKDDGLSRTAMMTVREDWE